MSPLVTWSTPATSAAGRSRATTPTATSAACAKSATSTNERSTNKDKGKISEFSRRVRPPSTPAPIVSTRSDSPRPSGSYLFRMGAGFAAAFGRAFIADQNIARHHDPELLYDIDITQQLF